MSTPSPVRTGIEAQGDSEYELDVGAVAAGGGVWPATTAAGWSSSATPSLVNGCGHGSRL